MQEARLIQKTKLLLVIFLTIYIVFVTAGPVFAQQPTPSDNDVNSVAKQMYCPVCENIPLDVCPTQACAQWRSLIREKLAEGWTDTQIKEYFVAQYGDRVLSEPPRHGLNWLVYLLPPVFFLGGAYIVYSVLKNMRAKAAPAAEETLQTNGDVDPYLAELEEELRRREKGQS